MYKRRARLLVAGATADGRAARVAALATAEDFALWLEVRAAESMAALDPESLAWGDLLIAVDPQAAAQFPQPRPATCRTKYWNLPSATDARLDAAILDSLHCMVGGMRMLARLDGVAPGDP